MIGGGQPFEFGPCEPSSAIKRMKLASFDRTGFSLSFASTKEFFKKKRAGPA